MPISTLLMALRSSFFRSTFKVAIETSDHGLWWDALVSYKWRLNPEYNGPRLSAPRALARHALRDVIGGIANEYGLLDRDRAEDAINALLCEEMSDHRTRIFIEARVRLRTPKVVRAAMKERMVSEADVRAKFALETTRLELLRGRLTDDTLGPVWWFHRYADHYFASGEALKVESALDALAHLKKVLDAASIDRTADSQQRVRRKLDGIFSAIQDPHTLSLTLKLLDRFFEHIGIAESKPYNSSESDASRRDDLSV